MVLELHAPVTTTGGRGVVAMVLLEKRIPFELVPIEWDTLNSKEHLAKQPFGQVPFIDDDGFILYESRAIARYLEEKYPQQGTKLIPTELKAKALFEQAASVEFADYEPYARAVYMAGKAKRFRGLPDDHVAFDEAVADLSRAIDVYEVILGKQKYLAGDELTLVDLFHIGFGATFEFLGCDLLVKGPNVSRWWKDIISRPSWISLSDGIKSTYTYE
ncbi:glutathione S-transferase [Mycena maculata]|uniref:glutathione transferase n=1 Tax=Mycena maculata TaxID=230809 RepID=A0AAD7MG61_9AGAR|nr:glutathione S-transferase [Mycena maculata]